MAANEEPCPAAHEGWPARKPVTLASGPARSSESGTIVLILRGPISRADIPALCVRARWLLERCDDDPVICDVGALADPDAVTVDALARLELTAGRVARRILLRDACAELQELLGWMGLRDVLPCGAGSSLQPRAQAEEGDA
jgi:hypothetical protein